MLFNALVQMLQTYMYMYIHTPYICIHIFMFSSFKNMHDTIYNIL